MEKRKSIKSNKIRCWSCSHILYFYNNVLFGSIGCKWICFQFSLYWQITITVWSGFGLFTGLLRFKHHRQLNVSLVSTTFFASTSFNRRTEQTLVEKTQSSYFNLDILGPLLILIWLSRKRASYTQAQVASNMKLLVNYVRGYMRLLYLPSLVKGTCCFCFFAHYLNLYQVTMGIDWFILFLWTKDFEHIFAFVLMLMCACLKEHMREVIDCVFYALYMVCTGSAVSWNHHDCIRQNMQRV